MEYISEDSPGVVSCMEKERLLVLQNKAFDAYNRLVSELAKAVGMMAHEEFEFLANRLKGAKEFFLGTRQQLNEHTRTHGC